MRDPRASASESSKPSAVPVGEPPTPEGAIKKAISELRDLVVDLNDGPWGPTTDPQVGIENVINFTLKPALEAAGGGGTGDRHLREALEWIEGFAIAGRDAEWDRVAGVARVALASVGEEDAVAEARGGSRWSDEQIERGAQRLLAIRPLASPPVNPLTVTAARAKVLVVLDAVFPAGEPDASEKDQAFKRGWAQGYAAGEDGGLEPDDARLVNTIRGPLEAQGLPTDDEGWAKLVRWVVAAVRAAGEERVTASEAKSVLSHMPALRGTPIFEKFERIAGGRRDA